MGIHVLIVEDDVDLRGALCDYLLGVGIQAYGIKGADALDQRLAQLQADVVICDINLPGESGFSIASRLRRASNAGIILLTARTKREDRILGLSLGADHFLTKPVDLHELEMIIRNLHERVQSKTKVTRSEGVQVDDRDVWLFDSAHWALISPDGEKVQLALVEYQVLHFVMTRAGEVTTRDELLAVLDRRNVGSLGRNLDMTISRLRKKVEASCKQKLPLISARGRGYVFTGRGRMVG